MNNQSFINKFQAPVFLAGAVSGIIFCYGLALMAGLNIQKTESLFHSYGIGFGLGTIATGICFIIAAMVNSSTCFNNKKHQNHVNISADTEVQNG